MIQCCYYLSVGVVILATPERAKPLVEVIQNMTPLTLKQYFANLLGIPRDFDSLGGVLLAFDPEDSFAVSPDDLTQPLLTSYTGLMPATEPFYLALRHPFVRVHYLRQQLPSAKGSADQE